MRIYLLKNKPVVNEQEKPVEWVFMIKFYGIHGFTYDKEKYRQALGVWEANCIPVVNVVWWNCEQFIQFTEGPLESLTITLKRIHEGQQVTAEISDGKATITKIQ